MLNKSILILCLVFTFFQNLTSQTAPANDSPSGAVPLANINDPCSFISGTTINATSEDMAIWGYSGPTCADASCSGGVTAFPKEVFYKFSSQNQTSVEININAPNQIGTVGLIRVFKSPNGYNNFSMHSCTCSPSASIPISSYQLTGLDPNTIYFIAVSPKVGTTGFWTDFDICVSASAVVPVILTFFEVKQNGSYLNFTWETTSEINSSHFEIEQKLEDGTFTSIKQIQAKGHSDSTSLYNEELPSPNNQTAFYRLKIIDFNGSFKYSSVETLRIENNTRCKAYPNPTKGLLTLEGIHEEATSYILYNHLFQISEKGLLAGNTLDLSKHRSGTYFLKLKNNQLPLIIQKI